MRLLSFCLPVVLLGLPVGAAAQGPPPPIRVPEQFQAPVEGYSMVVPYQLWRNWIERQKGPVTEQALAQADTFDGRERVGGPLIAVAYHNDYGRFANADVQVYCTIRPVYPDRNRGECSYLYRRAEVPISPSYLETSNALDVWMRANFDPALIVRNLRAAGVAPGVDLWGENKETIFDDAPSPQALLTEHLRIVRVDSRECPAFAAAVEALERARPDWILDLFAVGSDDPSRYPGPHATTATYKLNTRIDGQMITISGDGALEPLLRPVTQAAYGCERAQLAARP